MHPFDPPMPPSLIHPLDLPTTFPINHPSPSSNYSVVSARPGMGFGPRTSQKFPGEKSGNSTNVDATVQPPDDFSIIASPSSQPATVQPPVITVQPDLREKFLRRRMSPTKRDKSNKSDIDDVVDLKPSMKTIILPPLATPTNTLSSNTAPPNISPFKYKTLPPTGSPPPAADSQRLAWIAQAREWKELYADDAKAYFYYKETTQESQWETPTSQGYTRADTRLVLQNGTVIDDPALKASSSMSMVPSNQPTTASTTNDANTMLAHMQSWKTQEDAL